MGYFFIFFSHFFSQPYQFHSLVRILQRIFLWLLLFRALRRKNSLVKLDFFHFPLPDILWSVSRKALIFIRSLSFRFFMVLVKVTHFLPQFHSLLLLSSLVYAFRKIYFLWVLRPVITCSLNWRSGESKPRQYDNI